jgi:hypothetical protein
VDLGRRDLHLRPAGWIYGSTELPLVEKFPTYRICVLVGAVAIGFALWGSSAAPASA